MLFIDKLINQSYVEITLICSIFSFQSKVEDQKVETEVYTKVVDSGVLLTIRYLCIPKFRRDTEQDIWEKILLQFAKHENIQLAYPTIRRV